jgi:hypothetical protein
MARGVLFLLVELPTELTRYPDPVTSLETALCSEFDAVHNCTEDADAVADDDNFPSHHSTIPFRGASVGIVCRPSPGAVNVSSVNNLSAVPLVQRVAGCADTVPSLCLQVGIRRLSKREVFPPPKVVEEHFTFTTVAS